MAYSEEKIIFSSEKSSTIFRYGLPYFCRTGYFCLNVDHEFHASSRVGLLLLTLDFPVKCEFYLCILHAS